MDMVGQTQNRVHRRAKTQKNRWLYKPKHKKKLNLDAIWFFLDVCSVTLALGLTMIVVWWYFC